MLLGHVIRDGREAAVVNATAGGTEVHIARSAGGGLESEGVGVEAMQPQGQDPAQPSEGAGGVREHAPCHRHVINS